MEAWGQVTCLKWQSKQNSGTGTIFQNPKNSKTGPFIKKKLFIFILCMYMHHIHVLPGDERRGLVSNMEALISK